MFQFFVIFFSPAPRRRTDPIQDKEPQPVRKKRRCSSKLGTSTKYKRRKIYPKKMLISKTTNSKSPPEFEDDTRNPESDPVAFEEILDHIKTDESESNKTMKPFKCGSCKSSFNTEAPLTVHLQKNHAYSCSNCEKRFRTHAMLEAHNRRDHKGMPFMRCTLCKKRFTRPEALVIHMVAAHETTDKFFNCGRCGKKFTLEQNYLRHLDLHGVEDRKPLVCDICDSR